MNLFLSAVTTDFKIQWVWVKGYPGSFWMYLIMFIEEINILIDRISKDHFIQCGRVITWLCEVTNVTKVWRKDHRALLELKYVSASMIRYWCSWFLSFYTKTCKYDCSGSQALSLNGKHGLCGPPLCKTTDHLCHFHIHRSKI